ncbi:MAG: putative adhesin [Pseudomonadota bacterium]
MSAEDVAGLSGKYQKLGECMYLFPSTQNKTEALVSAHGGFLKGNKTFTVPQGMTVNFWAPHGYVLKDPGIQAMYRTRGLSPVETVPGGKSSIDYALTKYQGSHGGSKGKPAETYSSIANAIAGEDKRVEDYLDRLLKAKNEKEAERFQQQLASSGAMNVITIRNRKLRGTVWLSELVKQVQKKQPNIKSIHCSFCRASMVSQSDPQWSIAKGHVGFS